MQVVQIMIKEGQRHQEVRHLSRNDRRLQSLHAAEKVNQA